MIYRVPQKWIDDRRRKALLVAPLIPLLGVGILALSLGPRVDWSNSRDRTAAIIVACVVLVGLLLASLAGRMGFRTTMRRWETFSVELTPEMLVRQMDGQELRISRTDVTSIREFPKRGFVITDRLGWRIFVPKMVENYADFRQQIVDWGSKAK